MEIVKWRRRRYMKIMPEAFAFADMRNCRRREVKRRTAFWGRRYEGSKKFIEGVRAT
jgi:hypothetical protein